MKRTTLSAGWCVLLIAAASTGCAWIGGGGTAPAAPVDLAGTWTINEAESSDTTRVSMRGLERGVRVVPDREDPTARPAGTYPERLRRARVDGELAARILAVARQRIDELTVADSARTLTLRAGNGENIVITADGNSVRQMWLDGSVGQVRARWVGHRLEIVRRLDGGITVQEFYARSPGAARLVVFTIVTGPFDGEITLRRVYDLARVPTDR